MQYVERIYRQIHPEPAEGQMAKCGKLALFQDCYGLIILGDPGMGKTKSLHHEAAQDEHGCYIRAVQFIHIPPHRLNERYNRKTIYIDGFDEVRAAQGEQTAIDKLIQNIGKIDKVKFRLSCRSLEWDNIDLESMRALVDSSDDLPDDLSVISLEPLDVEQIEAIAEQEIEDHKAFLKEARDKDFFNLLGNPHNLNLFLLIYKQDGAVKNRTDLFEKACSALLKENNEAHASQRAPTYPKSDLIDISGLLCTIYMLTNSAGLSLTEAAESDSYPYILGEIEDKVTLAQRAAKTGLFSQDGTDRIIPCHRTIAEYLSAKYLIKRLCKGLPLKRVTGIITGFDGGTVSDLRGLYAWMTTLYPEKSDYLISLDPVGTLIYGDITQFSAATKRIVFNELKRVSKEHPWFSAEIYTDNGIGNIICPDLEQDILEVLNNGHENIPFLNFVLEALEVGAPLNNLAPPLLCIAQDTKFASHTRCLAINAYVRAKPDDVTSLKTILGKVHAGDIEDENREMRGNILNALYPSQLSAIECLQYIIPRNLGFVGIYALFLHCFIEKTDKSYLPAIAEAIINEPDENRKKFLQDKIGTQLFIPLLEEYGQKTDAENLYRWFSGLKDRHGYPDNFHEPEKRNQVREYYHNNPEIYKKLFEYWLNNIAPDEKTGPRERLFHSRIYFAGDAYPDHFGQWLLVKARSTPLPAIKTFLFGKALSDGCFLKYFDAPDYEEFLTIKDECEEFANAFQALSVCPLEDWKLEEMEQKSEDKRKEAEIYQRDIDFFQKNLNDVRQGKHWQSLEYVAWTYIYDGDQNNKFNLEKLYTHYPHEYCDAIMEGLENLLTSNDIPTLKKVASLNLQSKTLNFGCPFMYGCRAAQEKDKEWYKTASDKTLTYALATYWVSYNYAFEDDAWFYAVINHKPDLFIETVRAICGLKLSKGHTDITGLYELATEERLRPFSDQLIIEFIKKYNDITYENLKIMLRFCLLNRKWPEVEKIAATRTQKATAEIQSLWQAALYLANPEEYGDLYKKFLGDSSDRAWPLIEMLNLDSSLRKARMTVDVVEVNKDIIYMLGQIFPPESGSREVRWGGARDEYMSSETIVHSINQLASNLSREAGSALRRLAELKSLKSWQPRLLDAIKTNAQRRREQEFRYHQPEELLDILAGGKPHSHRDLKAFISDHIETLAYEYEGSSTNPYQKFWTENDAPHKENYCRNRIAEDLETRLKPLSIHVETEGTQRAEKRSDIKIINENRILPVEIKKNNNREIWTGIKQLQEQYSIDPKAQRHGIYIVLWFGKAEQCAVRKGMGFSKPQTPDDLKEILESLIAPEDQHLIDVIVIDLSPPLTSKEKRKLKN